MVCVAADDDLTVVLIGVDLTRLQFFYRLLDFGVILTLKDEMVKCRVIGLGVDLTQKGPAFAVQRQQLSITILGQNDDLCTVQQARHEVPFLSEFLPPGDQTHGLLLDLLVQ